MLAAVTYRRQISSSADPQLHWSPASTSTSTSASASAPSSTSSYAPASASASSCSSASSPSSAAAASTPRISTTLHISTTPHISTTAHISTSVQTPDTTPASTRGGGTEPQPWWDLECPLPLPSSPPPQPLLPAEHSHSSWRQNGPLTPQSATRAHHRAASLASLASLASPGPSSPPAAASNTYRPHIAGDGYHASHDSTPHHSALPLTPAHTPSREAFLAPTPPTNYYPHNSPPLAAAAPPTMGPDGRSTPAGSPATLAAPADAPATPPAYEEDRGAPRPTAPKLERTMTDVYSDELYNPNFHVSSAPAAAAAAATRAPSAPVPPQNDIFAQRLEAAQSQHLRAKDQPPVTIPSRERSPFRHGSPLAPQPASVAFGGSAQRLRQRQKQERDHEIYQQHVGRLSAAHPAPKTISPQEVDLQYHESEADAQAPLFPPRPEPPAPSDRAPPSYAGLATPRGGGGLSAYATASHPMSPPGPFHSAPPPAAAGRIRQMPQHYPFVPNMRRQPSNLSSAGDDFPTTLTSMTSSSSGSSSSDCAPEAAGRQRPPGAAADTGTYTCTYHGCTLRFDSPAKLQKHKREGHRSSASASAAIGSGDEGGMTSAAHRNSQAGPHKCERINPSTGKPCDTIFSRPYDLTRHEDTIHNAGKVKVQCPRCSEEKTFSRNDALTRHLRVVHPDYVDPAKSRRRAGHD